MLIQDTFILNSIGKLRACLVTFTYSFLSKQNFKNYHINMFGNKFCLDWAQNPKLKSLGYICS